MAFNAFWKRALHIAYTQCITHTLRYEHAQKLFLADTFNVYENYHNICLMNTIYTKHTHNLCKRIDRIGETSHLLTYAYTFVISG